MAPKSKSRSAKRSPKKAAKRSSSKKARRSASKSKSQAKSKSRSRSRSKKKVHKWQVLKGTRNATSGGLGADDLVKNKHGKVVSKKKNQMSKERAQAKGSWIWCVKKAREDLKLTGFQPIKKGTPLYKRSKLLFNNGGVDPGAGKSASKKSSGGSSNSGGGVWSSLGC